MRILLLTAIIIFASSASAGLYKWVDDEGNVHYSQKRPASQQFQRLKAPPPAPENAKPLYQPGISADKTGKTIKTETAKNAKIRADNCERAKKNLSAYQVSRRVRNNEGVVITLDDKTRTEQIENAKKHIAEYCK
ncbi:MAG: DUF4124 domain-containing protein [Gammaproteobacteria bacterium]|nr:DUF4124 domain-containing protein [Gammaproteobacteria bacterium]